MVCPDAALVDHIIVPEDYTHMFGSVVLLEAEVGYRFEPLHVKEVNVTCQVDGTWDIDITNTSKPQSKSSFYVLAGA